MCVCVCMFACICLWVCALNYLITKRSVNDNLFFASLAKTINYMFLRPCPWYFYPPKQQNFYYLSNTIENYQHIATVISIWSHSESAGWLVVRLYSVCSMISVADNMNNPFDVLDTFANSISRIR